MTTVSERMRCEELLPITQADDPPMAVTLVPIHEDPGAKPFGRLSMTAPAGLFEVGKVYLVEISAVEE